METPQSDPPNNPPPAARAAPPPAPAPEPPRAAAIVNAGKTPREIKLEEKLKEKDDLLKNRELSIAELQDANAQLRELPPTPWPKKKRSPATFFDEEPLD